MYHAGNNLEHITDLEDRGGRNTINLFTLPSSTACSFEHITSICLPILKSAINCGATKRTNVRNSLRGTDYGKRSLNDLLHLAKQDEEVQKKVGQLAKKNPEQTLRFHIDTAKIAIHTDRDKSQLVAELKEKWGVPMSIMRFDREDHQLARICRQISKHNKTRIIFEKGKEGSNGNCCTTTSTTAASTKTSWWKSTNFYCF